jgi:hypothetical protein
MLEKLIQYFVYQTKGYITKTQLVKFLYLADLYSVKWTGQSLTELEWYYYSFGPWQEDIDRVLKKLDGKQIIQESQGHSTLLKLGPDAGNVQELGLSLGLQFMLDNIRREWAGAGQEKLQQLLEYVYNTEPMLEIKQNNSQPHEKVKLNLRAEQEKLISELG